MSRRYTSSPPSALVACSGTALALALVCQLRQINKENTFWKVAKYIPVSHLTPAFCPTN
jgi:hypothetical protein